MTLAASALAELGQLDRSSRTPLHQQITDRLRSYLALREPGHQLPAEGVLVGHFGVSPNVVRHAITTLRQHVDIVSRRGIGLFLGPLDDTDLPEPIDEDEQARTDLIAELADIRQRSGLTQRQVAERMGIEPAAVSKLERRLKEPTFKTVQRYARAIGARLCAVVCEPEAGERT